MRMNCMTVVLLVVVTDRFFGRGAIIGYGNIGEMPRHFLQQ